VDLEEQHHHAEEVGHVPGQAEQIHLREPLLLPFPSLTADQIVLSSSLANAVTRLVGEWSRSLVWERG
jgi:hypothetical protein